MSLPNVGKPIDKISRIHDAGSCLGQYCPVHSPSDHAFVADPLYFDGVHMLRTNDSFAYGAIVDPDDFLLNRNGTAIFRNSAQCLHCGDAITSTFRHDFVQCSCQRVFVDGGKSYIRRGGDPEFMKDLTVNFNLFTINDYSLETQRYVLVESIGGENQNIVYSGQRAHEDARCGI